MKHNDKKPDEMIEIISDAKALYSQGPLFSRMIQRLRPYICPFHRLLAIVPKSSSILDVGCGSGIFIGLLIKRVGLSTAHGFDFSKPAIELAKIMQKTLPPAMANKITFEQRDANQPWPENTFDMVSMIDVMHHVPLSVQRNVFMQAVDHVAPGGLLLYKDMANQPFLYALTNRLHDLVMARQWINYAPISEVRSWGAEAGLNIEQESQCRMLWYSHEWIVFRKPSNKLGQ